MAAIGNTQLGFDSNEFALDSGFMTR